MKIEKKIECIGFTIPMSTRVSPGQVGAMLDEIGNVAEPSKIVILAPFPATGAALEVGIRLGIPVLEIKTDEFDGHGQDPVMWFKRYLPSKLEDKKLVIVIAVPGVVKCIFQALAPEKGKARAWADALGFKPGTYLSLTRFSRVSKKASRFVDHQYFDYSAGPGIEGQKAVA